MKFRRSDIQRIVVWLGAAVSPLLIAVAAPQGIVFKDKAGNMVLKNLTSWKTSLAATDRLEFLGKGNPLHGTWKDQGLTVEAQQISGTALKKANGAFRLASAEITGAVEATILQSTANGTRTSSLHSEFVSYNAVGSSAKIKGSFTFRIQSPGEGQSSSLKGTGAELQLAELGSATTWPILSGEVSGPVHVQFKGVTKETQGTPPKTVVATATAKRMTISDQGRTVRLIGDVHLEGDDTVVGGSVDASQATLRFNELHELVEVELQGEPGRSSLKESGGG